MYLACNFYAANKGYNLYKVSCILSFECSGGNKFLEFPFNMYILSSSSQVPPAQVESKETKTVERAPSGGKITTGLNPEATSGPSVKADDNVQTKPVVQVSTLKHVEYSEDRVVRVKHAFLF